MTITTILSAIGATALVLQAAIRVPHTLTKLLRACTVTVAAFHELRAALTSHHLRGSSQAPERDDDQPAPEKGRRTP